MAQDPRVLLQKVCPNLWTASPARIHPLTRLVQADKALAGAGGGFSFFGGRTEKFENAADLYTQAANAFRMQKQGGLPRRCSLKRSL